MEIKARCILQCECLSTPACSFQQFSVRIALFFFFFFVFFIRVRSIEIHNWWCTGGWRCCWYILFRFCWRVLFCWLRLWYWIFSISICEPYSKETNALSLCQCIIYSCLLPHLLFGLCGSGCVWCIWVCNCGWDSAWSASSSFLFRPLAVVCPLDADAFAGSLPLPLSLTPLVAGCFPFTSFASDVVSFVASSAFSSIHWKILVKVSINHKCMLAYPLFGVHLIAFVCVAFCC